MQLDATVRAAVAEAAKARRAQRDLMRFIPWVSPRFVAPLHLKPYVDVLERTRGETVMAVVNAPPRHGKTETTEHFIAQSLLNNPRIRIGYASYAADFAHRQSKRALIYAARAGVKFVDKRHDYWRTEQGGEVIWTSIGGPLTGHGLDLLLVDDPVKDRAEAESPTYRNRAWDWFNDVAFTRLEPHGSAIVMQTRWHHDDLAGRLIKTGWENVNLPAMNIEGAPLWPDERPADWLDGIRKQLGEYAWASLYMGTPVPRGASVFNEPHFYDALPTSGYRVTIGADFAYTSATYSDFNAAVVGYYHGGNLYIADVTRARCEVAKFKAPIQALHAKHGGRVVAFVAATEEGVIQFLASDRNGTSGRLSVESVRAKTDKFTRAQPVAAAWNAGRVLVPKRAPWLGAFLDELMTFTGLDDGHDDQVDALCGAFHHYAAVQCTRRVQTDTAFTFG